jgi:homogentisate phytyltransferase / homogentisate geranylgeranyltransferase
MQRRTTSAYLPRSFSLSPTQRSTVAPSRASLGKIEPENVTLEHDPPLEATQLHQHLAHLLPAIYRFTRPHTMLGTFVSVVSVSLLAAGPEIVTQMAVTAISQAISSALLMNVCIVGINQISDVDIDRINKPYLPLAAGDFSIAVGNAIVWATGCAALIIGFMAASPPLMATLMGSLALGIAYSTDVPYLRWKRFPIAAAACILAVRAVLVQVGFFAHMQRALGGGVLTPTRPLIFATGFMLLFSVVIAFFKDIPDVKGDKVAGVRTLSVRLGQRHVFWLCIGVLEAAYLGGVVVALSGNAALWRRAFAAAAHLLVGVLVWWRAHKTDLSDSHSIYACYMDVWKAFYIEYLLLPLLR